MNEVKNGSVMIEFLCEGKKRGVSVRCLFRLEDIVSVGETSMEGRTGLYLRGDSAVVLEPYEAVREKIRAAGLSIENSL